jgi:hypothetical protein
LEPRKKEAFLGGEVFFLLTRPLMGDPFTPFTLFKALELLNYLIDWRYPDEKRDYFSY